MGKIRLSNFRQIETEKQDEAESTEQIEYAETASKVEVNHVSNDKSDNACVEDSILPRTTIATKDGDLPFISSERVQLHDGSDGRRLCMYRPFVAWRIWSLAAVLLMMRIPSNTLRI